MVFTCLFYSSRNGARRRRRVQSPRAGGPVPCRSSGGYARPPPVQKSNPCPVDRPRQPHAIDANFHTGSSHLEGSHALLLAPFLYRLPRASRARRIRRQPGVDVAPSAMKHVALVEELVFVFGPLAPRACHTLHAACVKYLVGTPSTRRTNNEGRRVRTIPPPDGRDLRHLPRGRG